MVRFKSLLFPTVLMLLAGGIVSAAPAGKDINMLPSISPAYTKVTSILDGKLDDKVWAKATRVELNHFTTGRPAKEKTTAKLLYDNKNLYIGFYCHESKMNQVKATETTTNGPVFLDDCVEVMIAPSEVAMPGEYYHFAANILGTQYTSNNQDGDSITNTPWKVKTARQKDSWTVEMAIPFTSLKNPDSNAAFWRINLFRERYAEEENSSWAITDGTFHSPFKFGKLINININGKFVGLKEIIQPLKGQPGNESTRELNPAVSPGDTPVVIVPRPVQITLLPEDMVITPNTRIIVADNASKGNLQAAKEINEELKDEYGIELSIIKNSQALSDKGMNGIFLGEPETNSIIKDLDTELNWTVNKETPGAEGYLLKVQPQRVVIAGSDSAGTYYGVQSLKQLLRKKADQLVVKGAEIWDKPAFKVRSVHVLIDSDSPTVHAKMISKLFARFKMNQIIMEAERGIAWKSHPEINIPSAMPPDKIGPLVQYAQDHYMQVIPLIQSFGHGEWMFANKQNYDFCENTNYPYAYCPLNPKSYQFIFDIMDEAIELFGHPEYVHIGHDEVNSPGKIPNPNHKECSETGLEKLYYMDTIKIYEHLRSKGVKTMMWGDMFLKPTFRPYLRAIPKDVVIADWHYDPAKIQPSVDFYQDQGFQVLGSTWYIPNNIHNFSGYAHERKSLGMMQTTWAGYDQNISIIEREPQQVSGYILAADYFWNPVNRNVNQLGYSPDKVLHHLWYGKTEDKTVQKGFAVNLSPYANMVLADNPNNRGFLKINPGYDLSNLLNGSQEDTLHLWDDVNYYISTRNHVPAGIALKGNGITKGFPDKVEGITINHKAHSLAFLHTTLFGALTSIPAGYYAVNYADGTHIEIPLIYGKNISGWRDIETYYGGQLSWQGTTSTGEPVYIRQYEWENPYPDKEIKSLDFHTGPASLSPLLIAITGIL